MDEEWVTLHFRFKKQTVLEISNFQHEAGFPNKAELVRQALRYLYDHWRRTKIGSKILIGTETGEEIQEVEFPFWNYESWLDETIVEMSDEDWIQWLKSLNLKMPDEDGAAL